MPEKKVNVGIKGRYRIWILTGAVRYLHQDWTDNQKMNLGLDAIGKRLGNISGGGYVNGIGVGDSTTGLDPDHIDLQAPANKLWKALDPTSDITYVRPTLFAQMNFGYSEANFVWNELGIRDNNNVMWARQIDGTPVNKQNTFAATVEWQLTLS